MLQKKASLNEIIVSIRPRGKDVTGDIRPIVGGNTKTLMVPGLGIFTETKGHFYH